MSEGLPRFSNYQRGLRWSLAIGAGYDAVLAVSMALLPGLTAMILGVPLPADPYRWVLAVVVAMLAGFYALAAYDVVNYEGNVVVAIAGRAAAGLVLIFFSFQAEGFGRLLLPGVVDLAFAVVHAAFWLPIRR